MLILKSRHCKNVKITVSEKIKDQKTDKNKVKKLEFF